MKIPGITRQEAFGASLSKGTAMLGISALGLFFALQGCGGGSPSSTLPPPPVPIFTTIDVPGAGTSGFQGTYPGQITSAGDIVGTFYDSMNVAHGFLRTSAGVMTVLDFPGAGTLTNEGTLAAGMNSSGTIVGSFVDALAPTKTHGFIRSSDGTYTPFDFPAASWTNAAGIDDAGTVVGSYSIGAQVRGFLATNLGMLSSPAQFISFDPPSSAGGSSVRAFGCGIAPDGTVDINFLDNNLVWHSSLLLKDGSFVTIDAPGEGTVANTGTLAGFPNASGILVGAVFVTATTSHSFSRASDGTFTVFDPPGAGPKGSSAGLITDTGVIAGNYNDANTVGHGYVRAADGTFTSINEPNASQAPNSLGTTVVDMNSNGAIIGQYFDAAGVRHGYLRK